jgi:pimeloyl-ACP methyl ester carboxylesterase
MLQKKNIIIQGLNIEYLQSENVDKSKTLLFLHGWGSRALHFDKILENCESWLAVDLPGFGGSEAPKTAWSLADYSAFIQDFLQKLGIEDPILAGHSFGGSIGIKYCASGNKCQKLILIGSAGIRRKSAKNYGLLVIAKILKIFFFLPFLRNFKESVRQYFYEKIGSEDYLNAGILRETYKKIINEDLTKDLEKISVPTILIWGENDKSTPLADGRLMQSLIKNAKLLVIPKAGHFAFLDNKKEFGEIFLSQIK